MVADMAMKTQPPEFKFYKFAIENESTLKKLSGKNCIIRDGSAKR